MPALSPFIGILAWDLINRVIFHRYIGAESLRFRSSTVLAAGSNSQLNAWFGLLVSQLVGCRLIGVRSC